MAVAAKISTALIRPPLAARKMDAPGATCYDLSPDSSAWRLRDSVRAGTHSRDYVCHVTKPASLSLTTSARNSPNPAGARFCRHCLDLTNPAALSGDGRASMRSDAAILDGCNADLPAGANTPKGGRFRRAFDFRVYERRLPRSESEFANDTRPFAQTAESDRIILVTEAVRIMLQ